LAAQCQLKLTPATAQPAGPAIIGSGAPVTMKQE
jgi:hypothetical protein